MKRWRTLMYKIGVIGAGNMASAIINGALKAKIIEVSDIIVSDIDKDKLLPMKQNGIAITNDNDFLAKNSHVIILAVKPNVCETVLKQIRTSVEANSILVSIAAGTTIKYIKSFFDKEVKIIRVMPNTPALIGEGMSVISPSSSISDSELAEIRDLFSSIGRVEIMEERLMDAVTAISGSGPAYAFIFIEALADAGVMEGLPRNTAYTLAAQTLLGASKMVIELREHPAKLKDMVCSPGGTTIEAVYALEQSGFRGAVMEAVKECAKKSKYMEKE